MDSRTVDAAAAAYAADGVTVLRKAMDPGWIAAVRDELGDVIEEVCGEPMPRASDPGTFAIRSTEAIWEAVSREPGKRNLLYTYAQRVPTLYRLAGAEPLRRFSAAIAIRKPSVREAKVQMFLPWEKLFLQDCHQDINSLDSSNSITYWVPLHPLTEKTAVRCWIGSHREGPVRHEEIVDEAEALYLERVPEALQGKYPVVRAAVAADGDVIAINRLTFHQSPAFEDQLCARWSVVVRYDDLAGEGAALGTSRYEALAPNSPEKMKARLERIRSHLSQPPTVDWREKMRRAGAV